MYKKLLVVPLLALIINTRALKNLNLEECIKMTGVKISPDTMKQLHDANKGGNFDINSIPDEMLCLPKCVLEKRGILDSASGTISIDTLKNDAMLQRIPNKDAFLECMGKIKGVSECEDMKKILQCRISSQK